MIDSNGKKAVEIVLDYEQKQGRNPKDVSGSKENVGIDVISDSLKIEVKSRGKGKEPHFFLNEYNIRGLENISDNEYRLYLVFDVWEKPKIIIYTKQDILRKRKELRQWKIPLRKEDYAKAILV